MEKRRVVITGMGTVNPLGHNIAESWQAVRDGVCGIAPITQYDRPHRRSTWPPRSRTGTPPLSSTSGKYGTWPATAQLAMASAQGGRGGQRPGPGGRRHERCGVIVSSGIGGISTTESEQTRCLQKGFDRASPFYIPSSHRQHGRRPHRHRLRLQGDVHLPGDRLRRRLQRGGRRLPPHPGRLRRSDAVRRRRGRRDPAVHRRLHLHAGPARRGRPRPRLHPL